MPAIEKAINFSYNYQKVIIMNKKILLAVAISIFSSSSIAENIIRTSAPVIYKPQESWSPIDPVYSDWANLGSPQNCTNWAPLTSLVADGTSFSQSSTDCEQYQTRSRQEREQEAVSQVIRDKGAPTTETQTVSATSTRSAIGTDTSAPLTRYFTFIEGTGTGQLGCNYESRCMSIPAESSMNGKSAIYMTIGYSNAVNFGLIGYSGNQLKAVLAKLRIEMFDANGLKYYTLTQTAPFSNQYGNYVGNSHTSEDYEKAATAHKMRVSFELSE